MTVMSGVSAARGRPALLVKAVAADEAGVAALAVVLTSCVAVPAAATCAATAASTRGQSHDHGPLRTVVVLAVTLPRQGR